MRCRTKVDAYRYGTVVWEAHMLNDAELEGLFQGLFSEPPPADPDAKDSPIQPASIDLTIGDIYVPSVKPKKRGKVDDPKTQHVLKAGQTAVVVTKEEIEVPNTIGAIGFPPTNISHNGILMTNPGHVDPGFKGKLTFTVINMGREDFSLRRDDLIVTLVFFKLIAAARKGYRDRRAGTGSAAGAHDMTRERMNRLAPDMLDMDRRVEGIAKNEEHKTRRWGIIVPVALAAVVATGTIFGPQATDWLHNRDDMRSRLAVLEERSKTQSDLQARLDRLEQQVAELKAKLEACGVPNNGRG
jgi:dCTP deaminase